MPQATVNLQKYLVLGVKNGLGYHALENACIRVSPIFSKQRLLSLFSYGDVFTYDFSWTLDDNCLNRLRSSGAMIRIEVWAKRSGRHFIIGYAVIGIKRAQFANQNDKLFSHRLRLQSGVKNSAEVVDTEILVTLNIQNTPPEFTYDEICQEANLQWLKYCSEAEVDYLSDSSEDTLKNDKLKNKRSRNRMGFDENGEIWKTTDSPIGSVWEGSSDSSSSSVNGIGLKSEDIPSIFPLLRSENPELLSYSEKNQDKNQESSKLYTDFDSDVDIPEDLEISPSTQVQQKAEVHNSQKLNAKMRKIRPKEPANDPFMRAEQLILKTNKLALARDKKNGKMLLKGTPPTYKTDRKQPEQNKNKNEDSCDVSSDESSINLLESKSKSEYWWIKNTKENAKKKMCPEAYNDISAKTSSLHRPACFIMTDSSAVESGVTLEKMAVDEKKMVSTKLSSTSIINSEENSHNENNIKVVSSEKSPTASVNKRETVLVPMSFTISCGDFGSKSEGQTSKEKNIVSNDERKTVPAKSFTINFTNSEEICRNKNNVEETHIAPLDKKETISNKSSVAIPTNSIENQDYKDNFQNVTLEKTAAASVNKTKTISNRPLSMYTMHLEINQENENNNQTTASSNLHSNTHSKPTFNICNIKPAVQFDKPPVCTLLKSLPENAVLHSKTCKDDEFKIKNDEQAYYIAESLVMLVQSYRERKHGKCPPKTAAVYSETQKGVEHANCPSKIATGYSETNKDDEYATYPLKTAVMHSEAYTDVDSANYQPKTSTVHSEIYKDVNNVHFPSKTTSVCLETHKDDQYQNRLSENLVMYSEASKYDDHFLPETAARNLETQIEEYKNYQPETPVICPEASKDDDNLNLIPETTVMHRKTHKDDKYTNCSPKNVTLSSETYKAAGNGNCMSLLNQVDTVNTAFDVKTSNKTLTSEYCQNCYKVSNRNMSNTSEEENREKLHCYLLNMHIKSIKWYSNFKDIRVSVRFFNPTDENIVTALEGERLSSLDKLLSYVTCHLYYVCAPACLLKTVNTYPPSVLICKMYKNTIAKGHLTIKYSKAKPQKQYFHGYIPLFSKHKEKVAALFVRITFEDLGLTMSDKIDHFHTECILKFIHTMKDTRCSIISDLNKLSQLTKGCQNIIYKHATNCFSSNENYKQMQEFENQSISSTSTEMLETILDKSDNNEMSSTNYKITDITDKSLVSLSDISSYTSYSSAEVFYKEEYKTWSTNSATKEENCDILTPQKYSSMPAELRNEEVQNIEFQNDALQVHSESEEFEKMTQNSSSHKTITKGFGTKEKINEHDENDKLFSDQKLTEYCSYSDDAVIKYIENQHEMIFNRQYIYNEDSFNKGTECDLECLHINDEVVPDQTDNNENYKQMQEFENQSVSSTSTETLETIFGKSDNNDTSSTNYKITNITDTEIPEDKCDLECLHINDEVVPDQTDNCDLEYLHIHDEEVVPDQTDAPKCDLTEQNPYSHKIQDGFDKQHIAKTKTNILNTYPEIQHLLLPEIPEDKCDIEYLHINDEVVVPDQTDAPKCDLTEQNTHSHNIQDGFDKRHIAKTNILNTYTEKQKLFPPEIPEDKCHLQYLHINDEEVADQTDACDLEYLHINDEEVVPDQTDAWDLEYLHINDEELVPDQTDACDLEYLHINDEEVVPDQTDTCDLECLHINDEVVPDQTDNPKCDLTEQNTHSHNIQDGFDKRHIAKTNLLNTYPEKQNLFLPEIPEDKCDLECIHINDEEVVSDQTDACDLEYFHINDEVVPNQTDKCDLEYLHINDEEVVPDQTDACDLEYLHINDEEVVPDQTDACDLEYLHINDEEVVPDQTDACDLGHLHINDDLVPNQTDECDLEYLHINDEEVVPDQTDACYLEYLHINDEEVVLDQTDACDLGYLHINDDLVPNQTDECDLEYIHINDEEVVPDQTDACDLECIHINDEEVVPDQTDACDLECIHINDEEVVPDQTDACDLECIHINDEEVVPDQTDACDLECIHINDEEVVPDQTDACDLECIHINDEEVVPDQTDACDLEYLHINDEEVVPDQTDACDLGYLHINDDLVPNQTDECDLEYLHINDEEVVPDQTDACDLEYLHINDEEVVPDQTDACDLGHLHINDDLVPNQTDKCDLEYLHFNDEVVPDQADACDLEYLHFNDEVVHDQTDACDLEYLHINDEVLPDQTNNIQILEIRSKMRDISAALEKCYEEYGKLQDASCETWDKANVMNSISNVDNLLCEWSRLETELNFLEDN